MSERETNVVVEVAALLRGYTFLPGEGAYLEARSVAVELLSLPVDGSKVGNLRFNLVPPRAYEPMRLTLTQEGGYGRHLVREATTDESGRAAFWYVLLDVPCSMEAEMAAPSPERQGETPRLRVGRGPRRNSCVIPGSPSSRFPSGSDVPRANSLREGDYVVLQASPASGKQAPFERLVVDFKELSIAVVIEAARSGGTWITFITEDGRQAAKVFNFKLGPAEGRIDWQPTASGRKWRSEYEVDLPPQTAVELHAKGQFQVVEADSSEGARSI